MPDTEPVSRQLKLNVESTSREQRSEITPMVEVGACMRVAKKSVGHTGRADIFTQIIICLFLHADILRYIVLQVCNPRYSGEYKLNYISLFNLPSLWDCSLRVFSK